MKDGVDSGSEQEASGLGQTFLRYRKTLARLVARIVSPSDIEDIVQETYVRIYQASQTSTIQHPKSFMQKTARNIALNHVRRADAMNHLTVLQFEQNELEDQAVLQGQTVRSAESLALAEEDFLLFCRAVRELPQQCRRAFVLRQAYGMSQQAIAAQLGISEKTVEKHLAKGIVICHAYMKAHGYAHAAADLRGRIAAH